MKVRCMHTGDNCHIHQESETERERDMQTCAWRICRLQCESCDVAVACTALSCSTACGSLEAKSPARKGLCKAEHGEKYKKTVRNVRKSEASRFLVLVPQCSTCLQVSSGANQQVRCRYTPEVFWASYVSQKLVASRYFSRLKPSSSAPASTYPHWPKNVWTMAWLKSARRLSVKRLQVCVVSNPQFSTSSIRPCRPCRPCWPCRPWHQVAL